jgi:hypothetical protein
MSGGHNALCSAITDIAVTAVTRECSSASRAASTRTLKLGIVKYKTSKGRYDPQNPFLPKTTRCTFRYAIHFYVGGALCSVRSSIPVTATTRECHIASRIILDTHSEVQPCPITRARIKDPPRSPTKSRHAPCDLPVGLDVGGRERFVPRQLQRCRQC